MVTGEACSAHEEITREDRHRQKGRGVFSALEIPESLRELTWQFGPVSLECG